MSLRERRRARQELRSTAQPVFDAIKHDETKAPARLRPLFQAIRRLLFMPDLSLELLRRVARLDDERLFKETFVELTGLSPWSYVREARLEAAARMLLTTSYKVVEIGRLVGYPNVSSFRKAFAGFAGESPTAYQRRARRLLVANGPPPRQFDDPAYWERMLAGDLGDEEARELDGVLAGPEVPPEPAESPRLRPWMQMHGAIAMALVDALGQLPWTDQRLVVRDAVWFPDRSLFKALSLQGERVSAKDPARGAELALLAIDGLAATGLLGADAGLAVVGWNRVARARWRCGDLPGAEDALQQMRRDLERYAAADRLPVVEAERARLEAAWHWFHGRREEALKAADHWVAQERAGGKGQLGRALLLRAEIRTSLEPASNRRRHLHAVEGDLDEARGLSEEWSWEWPVFFEAWILVLARLGEKKQMAKARPDVRRIASEIGPDDAGISARMRWFESRVEKSRERLWERLCEACKELVELGERVWVARATLDLLRSADSAPEASKLAAQLAAVLGEMVQSTEGLEVVHNLKKEAAEGSPQSNVLDAADAVLARLDSDRKARQVLRFVAG